MLTTMESCLRFTRRKLHKWALDPRVQSGVKVAAWGGSGFFLSSLPLNGSFQPLAMGLICAAAGWQALVMALGAMTGYRIFWGSAGIQGMVWAAAAWVLSLAGKQKTAESYPLLVPALTAVVTALSGLIFLLFRREGTLSLFFLRLCLAPVSALFFRRAFAVRDSLTDWVCGGIAVLSLVGTKVGGYALAGVFSVWASFPAAALAGLGLDLARITQVPMSAVVCIAWLGRMIPFRDRWMRFILPGAACLGVMGLCGIWDPAPLPGLAMGGIIGYFLPPRPDSLTRRGETGIVQVRLELAAGVMAQTQRLLLEVPEREVDEGTLLNRAINRACGVCPSRENCVERLRLGLEYLHHPESFACRRPWEIQGELIRARDRLRDLQADRQKQREYRRAMVQQYQFLAVYLQRLSDQLPRRGERLHAYYRLEVSARSRGKERANGDRCMAFPGTGCRYYVLLCDGMGTGLGAAQEGQTTGELLRQMLSAGFPPEHALRSVNSLLVLRDTWYGEEIYIHQPEDIRGLYRAIIADCKQGTMAQQWDFHHPDESLFCISYAGGEAITVFSNAENTMRWLRAYGVDTDAIEELYGK